ncbi:MAG: ABC transporter permease, partial [Sphaerochaetaceae bacterium]
MSKLLRQGFFRLRKNLVFYLCILFMIGSAILRLVTSYRMKVEYGYQIDIGEMLFSATLLLGIAASVFSGLFLGTEYSDGTMRNKLIVGHGRLSIYLSSLVVVTSAILVMFFSYFFVILGIGSILFGFTQVPIALLLLNSGSVVLL